MFTFENVDFFRDHSTILSSINWKVNKGENWAILGLNGSGKTTLLQLLCGYLWPTNGRLEVLGEIFGKTSIPELRTKIGWVSSALQYQLKNSSPAEQIVLSGKYASIGLYHEIQPKELLLAKELLAEYGGADLIGKRYQVLSQGERQTVLIARALMADPELLILDEPCNGLDLFASERLLQQIEVIAKSAKAPTLLYVTHHTEEILPCFQHLLLLKAGEIFAQGPTSRLMNTEILNAFYPHPVEIIQSQITHRLTVIPK